MPDKTDNEKQLRELMHPEYGGIGSYCAWPGSYCAWPRRKGTEHVYDAPIVQGPVMIRSDKELEFALEFNKTGLERLFKLKGYLERIKAAEGKDDEAHRQTRLDQLEAEIKPLKALLGGEFSGIELQRALDIKREKEHITRLNGKDELELPTDTTPSFKQDAEHQEQKPAKKKTLRPSRFDKEKAQTIAERIWYSDKHLRPTDVAKQILYKQTNDQNPPLSREYTVKVIAGWIHVLRPGYVPGKKGKIPNKK